MRKLFVATLGAILCVAPALAQPPAEVEVNDTITMRPGETRIYKFDQSVNQIDIVDPIAEVKPQTDRTFTFRAISSGSTMLTAYNGKDVVYRARVVVEGHLVKIYGQGGSKTHPDYEIGGYASYLCTSTGCGRANPDVAIGPNRVTIQEDAQGNVKAVEKTYR
jgi:hypothetical protein